MTLYAIYFAGCTFISVHQNTENINPNKCQKDMTLYSLEMKASHVLYDSKQIRYVL